MRVLVVKFTPNAQNTRRGYADLKIADIGLAINGCAVHRLQGDDGRPRTWVALPSKPYENKAGEKKWWPIVLFDKEQNAEFQRAAIAALNAHVGGAVPESAAQKPAPAQREFDDKVPF